MQAEEGEHGAAAPQAGAAQQPAAGRPHWLRPPPSPRQPPPPPPRQQPQPLLLPAEGPAAAANGPPAEGPPATVEDVAEVAGRLKLLGPCPLNPEQCMAVAAMLCGGGRAAPYALFGPPGTGKSVTVVEAILQIRCGAGSALCGALRAPNHQSEGLPSLAPRADAAACAPRATVSTPPPRAQHPTARLLAAAPTNFSADLIASALGACGMKPWELLRVRRHRAARA
jgi:hypothetical protein